jgi:hypothetical protein
MRAWTIMATLAGFGLAACRGGPTTVPPNDSFRGIVSASSPTEQLRVLFIHGIGISDAHSADALLLHLKDALGFKQPVPEPEPQTIYVEGVPTEDNAVLYNFQFVAEPGHGPIKFSFLLWSPLTTHLKTKFDPLDTVLDKDPRLAWVNNKGKQFLHDNLSDVALYGGTYRQVIRAAVEQALCSFIGGTPHPNSPKTCTGGETGMPTAVITHSMGAYMLMDATCDLAGPSCETGTGSNGNAAEQMLGDLKYFAWLANQISFLDMTTLTSYPADADTATTAAPRGPFQRLHPFLNRWRARRNQSPLEIVALSDPNDLLSFYVSQDDIADMDVKIHNVILSNSEWNWLGIFANPVTAHDGYLANNTAMRVVACGMSGGAVATCKP